MNQCQSLFISALAEEAPGAFPDDKKCISIHSLSCASAGMQRGTDLEPIKHVESTASLSVLYADNGEQLKAAC